MVELFVVAPLPTAIEGVGGVAFAVEAGLLEVDFKLTGLDVLQLNRITLEGAFGEKKLNGLEPEARKDA